MMTMMIGACAGVGACCRYGIMRLTSRWHGMLPYNTLLINLLGSFALGLMVVTDCSSVLMKVVTTGFLGGFTTFSTFENEAAWLLKNDNWRRMTAYILVSLIGGVMMAAAGVWMGMQIK